MHLKPIHIRLFHLKGDLLRCNGVRPACVGEGRGGEPDPQEHAQGEVVRVRDPRHVWQEGTDGCG